jgi:putative membrane protein insertion efficiency factor
MENMAVEEKPEIQTAVIDRRYSFDPIARLLMGGIWVYQKTLSPVLPAVFGPACGCRFYPTCSHYAAEALRTHGALVGTWFALRRLLKCTPLHPGGLDPVPAPSPRTPRCTRVAA